MWNTVRENWDAMRPAIHQRWPVIDPGTLDMIRGDRQALISHLAQAGELTPTEAEEELANWVDLALPASAPPLDRVA